MVIEYRFLLENGRSPRFGIDLDRKPSAARGSSAPAWTRLDYHPCRNCPLSADTSHCPAALDLQEVIEAFQDIISYQAAQVEVITPERTYSRQCDVQTGLRSLFGLLMATSGCPVLNRLRGLAFHHLPFATLEETLLRSVGAYLLEQYYRAQRGEEPDLKLSGLEALYRQVQWVDVDFKQRINAAAKMDATLNALGSLGFLAMGVHCSLEEMLQGLEPFALGRPPE